MFLALLSAHFYQSWTILPQFSFWNTDGSPFLTGWIQFFDIKALAIGPQLPSFGLLTSISLHKHHSPLAKIHTSFWEKFIFTTLCSDWYHSLSLSNTFSSRLKSYLPNSALFPRSLSSLSSLLFFCMSLTYNVFIAILSVSYSLLFVFANSWSHCKFLGGRGLVSFTLSFPPLLQLQFSNCECIR